MIINENHEVVAKLVAEWKGRHFRTDQGKKRGSLLYQQRLAKEVVEPLTSALPHELFLFYHEHLVMMPTGEHSLAFGSVMAAQTIYEVVIGQMSGAPITRVRARRSKLELPDTPAVNLYFPPKFLLPVVWWIQVWPIYRSGTTKPCYTSSRPGKEDEVKINYSPLDLSAFGQHLFQARKPKEHDWATRFTLALGNESVEKWLREHGSHDLYRMLHAFATE
jgi:hypothetical protein